MRVVLASKSPRRVELLQHMFDDYGLTIAFAVEPADIDETPRGGESPRDMVLRLARQKAAVVVERHADDAEIPLVIAADTTVDVDGENFGQPVDMAHAEAMLRHLSGRTHTVHTGVCVARGGRAASHVESAQVTMVSLTDEQRRWYLATGESVGKAGAYAIQGEGAALVERVEGSLTAVIGLPIEAVADLLGEVAPGWNLPG
jgi:septum formation protein